MSTMLRILHILKHWNMIPYIDLLMNIVVLFLNKSPTYQGSWLWGKKAGADTAPPRTLPATTPPPSLASRCWPHSAWSWCNPPWHPHGDLSRAWELYWHFVAEIVVYQSCVSSRVVNISFPHAAPHQGDLRLAEVRAEQAGLVSRTKAQPTGPLRSGPSQGQPPAWRGELDLSRLLAWVHCLFGHNSNSQRCQRVFQVKKILWKIKTTPRDRMDFNNICKIL